MKRTLIQPDLFDPSLDRIVQGGEDRPAEKKVVHKLTALNVYHDIYNAISGICSQNLNNVEKLCRIREFVSTYGKKFLDIRQDS